MRGAVCVTLCEQHAIIVRSVSIVTYHFFLCDFQTLKNYIRLRFNVKLIS